MDAETEQMVGALRDRTLPGDRQYDATGCYSESVPDTLCHQAATAIETLTAERDAALARVAVLEDALRAVMHDWHSDTGFVAAVRLATGRPWPWDHGELSLDAARKALEAIHDA